MGIGFVTGRKSFKRVARTYLSYQKESGLPEGDNYSFHMFIAYDLSYTDTQASDYKLTEEELLHTVDSTHYLGGDTIEREAQALVDGGVITREEAGLIFGEGYGMKRNAVLYFAMKAGMDYLIFLDDDEYPFAVLQLGNDLVWKGQSVLSAHLRNLPYCDMTHGHHCGYVSPIPRIEFDGAFTEDDFRTYITAISNDIISWDSVQKIRAAGGVTYADLEVINDRRAHIIPEVGGMKFISGANLGFNLKNPDKVFPFYNPPGARGEDTFLSTSVQSCAIRKIPCYTFHDGFSMYQKLLSGILPNRLRVMNVGVGTNYKRFLRASIGWVRYKPLLVYVTQPSDYSRQIARISRDLETVIPKLCAHFGTDDFKRLQKEFSHYCAHVGEHFEAFQRTKAAWRKLLRTLF